MRKTVAVAPGFIMFIRDSAGDKLLHEQGDILEQTGFVFDSADSGCRASYRDSADSLIKPGFIDYSGNVRGDIMDTADTLGFNVDIISIYRHVYSIE